MTGHTPRHDDEIDGSPAPNRRVTLAAALSGILAGLSAPAGAQQPPAPQATAKKKAYSIVDVKITDREAFYGKYVPGHAPSVAKFGGRFLVATPKKEIIEGTWPQDNTVVVHEWPDIDAFKAWYASPDYAPWKEIRHKAATANVILVEGTS